MQDVDEENLLEEDSSKVPLCIFEGNWQEHVPAGFQGIVLSLDGRMEADLNWKMAQKQAEQAIERGYKIMWKMELGLFSGLLHPLAHQTQFLSLALALEHFRDGLWKMYQSHTIGLSLFEGLADFSAGFPWDDIQRANLASWLQEIGDHDRASLPLSQLQQQLEGGQLVRLFCRDVAIEYLSLLAARLPDSLSVYLYLDMVCLQSCPVKEMQFLNSERYTRLKLALKNHRLPFEVLGWEVPSTHGYSGQALVDLPTWPPISIGVCLPPPTYYHSSHYQGLAHGVQALQALSLPFKLIPEGHLTTMWEELDYLLYSPLELSPQGKRKLQGFCAAGGTAVSTGDLIGLPQETTLAAWLNMQAPCCPSSS